ncbi:hypothetical protein K435DRAFT_667781, partial [Dendrothele bispora CBS 962.96]
HLHCDDQDPSGCKRCCPTQPVRCCDLCSPGAFDDIQCIDPPVHGTSQGKMRVGKYEPSEVHEKLRTSLEEWHLCTTQQKLGNLAVRQWGPQLFMSNQTLDRIVDCATTRTLNSVEVLRVETQWKSEFILEYGQEILDIVHIHFPPVLEPAQNEKGKAP